MYPRFQESNNPKNIKAYVLHILLKKHIYPLQNQRIRQKKCDENPIRGPQCYRGTWGRHLRARKLVAKFLERGRCLMSQEVGFWWDSSEIPKFLWDSDTIPPIGMVCFVTGFDGE